MNQIDNIAQASSRTAADNDDTVLLPRIPGYTLHSILGTGGMATVYLATQRNLNRQVALKVMNPAYASDADLCERFEREGQDLAVVSEHVSIVTVHDVGKYGNLYYISMQYLPGPTLRQLIRSDEPYQHPLYIISRVAEALSFAHEKGYVHRDIKPANILFNAQGEAILSDFGIAKTQNRNEELTQLGQMVGTENYMSPEQALMSEKIDGRTDIYSLGVVFYETLTRCLPYRSTGNLSVVAQHISADVPTLPESESKYQPLINRMMAKNPDDRYATTNELLDDLQQFFLDPAEQVIDPLVTTGRNKWVLASAVIVGLCVSALLGSFFLETNIKNMPPRTIGAQDQITITESLELAELNELMGRIDSPPGSNALELYNLVLEIDPSNKHALAALQRLNRP